MSQKTFSVAIVGGGIGGLALAVGLLRRQVPVQIYEAAPAFGESGLGLTIGPAAHRAMPLLDARIRQAYDALVTTHADSPGYERFAQTWFEIVWASGPRAGELLLDLKAHPSGQTTLRRADFLDALVRLVPAEAAHFGKRLVRLDDGSSSGSSSSSSNNNSNSNSPITLHFADGSTAHADVVIGCDGIHSKVADALVSSGSRPRPQYSGMYGYRAVLDMQTVIRAVGDHRARVATLYVGRGAYAVTYPVQRAQRVNVGLYRLAAEWDDPEQWVRPARRDEMLRDFAHMGDAVNALMEHMHDSSQWAIFEQLPAMETFAKGRIAVLGDAAHASTPHQGAGAGQAIEDAHVLAELLGDAVVRQTEQVGAALRAYDAVRRPRAQRVVVSSKENADLLCLAYDGVADDEHKLRSIWRDRFRWLWDLDVVEQAESARRIMLELLRKQQHRQSLKL